MFSASKSGQYQGYQISRSVRLRSSASAYFNRNIWTSANRTTWTASIWIKRGILSSLQTIMGSYDGVSANASKLYFTASDALAFDFGGSATNTITTSAVFRDPSAWYHIVLSIDTTQATAANRIGIYVNGVQQTTTGTPVAQNTNTLFWVTSNNAFFGLRSADYLDGYLAEINVVNGQALTPSSFGVTNAYGVWSPIKYNGTYGTNGFYLNFSDNSGATATTIGKDSSGNGNNWTPNNINVSAYTGTPPNNTSYDSMLDVPTPWGDGGNGRGNYCTLNPLVVPTLSGGATVSNGNLRVAGSAGVSNAYARGTMALSGKFYAEFFFDVVNATASIGVDVVTATAGALNTSSTAVSYRSGGNRRVLGTESAYGASWAANDIIGVAVDTTANTIEFFKNGASQGVITSSAFFAQGDCIYAMSKDDVGSPTGYANFGQRPFSYTPPSGFKALNTFNLPEPAIDNGREYMAATTYTGTGASRSVDNTVNNVSFQPDFVWVKGRSGATDHALYDSVRGVQLQLESNTTTAETTETTGLTAFNANGFAVGALAQMNTNTATYVGWQWRAGVSSVSNTSGSITSTVDAGTTQGFSIVTWTGNGSTGTVGHGLGVAPRFIITKYRNVVNSWSCYHASLGASSRIFLNTTDASGAGVTDWNSTSPTSSVFSVGNANTNASGGTYVAYCFAEITGFSRFSSYTGNGSADGPFVFCGFRPRWIMTKLSSAAGGGWWIYDTARDPYNATNDLLQANLSNASATSLPFDILSNGFKIRTSNVGANTNAATYIFAAFAENPFKYALAR